MVDREFVYVCLAKLVAPQDAPGGRPGDSRGRPEGGPGHGQEATKAIARRYFDFFRDVPRGIIGFETISGRGGEARGSHSH